MGVIEMDDETRHKINQMRTEIGWHKDDMGRGGPDRSKEIVDLINQIRELEKQDKLHPKHKQEGR